RRPACRLRNASRQWLHQRPRCLRARSVVASIARRNRDLHGYWRPHRLRHAARDRRLRMRRIGSSFISGVLFGAGLTISQMVNPRKVTDFLDFFGNWDPSLAFVMGGALLVTALGFRIVLRRAHPLFVAEFHLPSGKRIDAPLVG